MVQQIILATTGGRLYRYNFRDDLLSIIFKDTKSESLMGLEREGEFLYVAAQSRIYKFKMNNNLDASKIFKNSKGKQVGFHQMIINGQHLYIATTRYNEIWKFDLDLNLCERFKIVPPNKSSPTKYGRNYNHLNNIFYHNNNFYICLNWLTQGQFGLSGVAILNNEMKEIDRLEYGWEAHNYCILDNRKYVLCSSSGAIKPIHHIHRAGLMVDGKLVFEHNPNLFFCKDFSVEENYIYIAGGSIKPRNGRNHADGILFVLDRNFNLIFTRKFTKSGGICGCILPHGDLTKGERK